MSKGKREKSSKGKKKKKIPKIYIDTNFILDCTEGRNRDSIHIMEKIRENKWNCISSSFTIMEISDIIKDSIFVAKKLRRHWTINKILRERYKKDLKEDDFEDVENYIINKIFSTYPFIELFSLTEPGWPTALDISTHSNISAPDVMHISLAWNYSCDVILTSDGELIKEFKKLREKYTDLKKIEICTPKQLEKTLKKLKFIK